MNTRKKCIRGLGSFRVGIKIDNLVIDRQSRTRLSACLVEAAGVEPASENLFLLVLHAYPHDLILLVALPSGGPTTSQTP